MNILVINAGSSSLKFQLINMISESVLAKGTCERIGFDEGVISFSSKDKKNLSKQLKIKNHVDALNQVIELILDQGSIDAVGHRVVQGGDIFKTSTIIDSSVIKKIESLIPLAPLHNKPQVQTINACTKILGNSIKQVAVFDTSFHSTMSAKAFMYALPYEYYEKHHIRKYGFHGTSHRFVSQRCASLLNQDVNTLKLITCHFGNGSSITAIKNGKVVDTSMGLTPLDGLIMGTRCGCIDPAVVAFIAEKENLSVKEVNDVLNKKSGILGVSGVSNDLRDVKIEAENGNKRARLVQEMITHQVCKFIGAYTAIMNGVDSIVFTGGIGENAFYQRLKICNSLEYFGVSVDPIINQQTVNGKEACISNINSKVKVFVIPTNEELIIARDTQALIEIK